MASIESKDNGDYDIEYYERTGGKELQEIKMIPDIKREVDNFKERLNNSSRYTMILNMLIALLATTILILLIVMFANAGASSTPEAGGLDDGKAVLNSTCTCPSAETCPSSTDAETPATPAGKHDIKSSRYLLNQNPNKTRH